MAFKYQTFKIISLTWMYFLKMHLFLYQIFGVFFKYCFKIFWTGAIGTILVIFHFFSFFLADLTFLTWVPSPSYEQLWKIIFCGFWQIFIQASMHGLLRGLLLHLSWDCTAHGRVLISWGICISLNINAGLCYHFLKMYLGLQQQQKVYAKVTALPFNLTK